MKKKMLEEQENDDLLDLSMTQNLGLDLLEQATEKTASPARMLRREEKKEFARLNSERNLLELFTDNLFDYTKTYYFLTSGKINFLSFLKMILLTQKLDYCLLSTWCMKLDDVCQIEQWVEAGQIALVDVYVGEIFPASYRQELAKLTKVVRQCGGRVCVFRNHAKIFAGKGEKFSFGISSSANIDTNPRLENTVLTFGDDIFHFYKDYFDGIVSFNRDFDDWEKKEW